jgi:predicted MFS family arabinose efflux permease
MSINGMVLRLGQTVGPPLMGLALGVWGIEGAFYAAAAVAAAMFVLTTLVIKQRRNGDGS